MANIRIERLPEGIRINPAPATPRDWLRRQAAKVRRASVVSRAMASHAIDGALDALDSDNPFTAL